MAGQFQEADYTVAVFGGDSERGGSVDGVADVCVVGAIVTVLGLDWGADEGCGVGWVGGYGQGAPVGVLFCEPVAFAHAGDFGSGYEGGLLWVEAVFSEAAPGAVKEEAWGVDAGKHGGAAVGAEARIVEGDVEGVFDGAVVAVFADACGDGFGDTKEDEGLIDEVGP